MGMNYTIRQQVGKMITEATGVYGRISIQALTDEGILVSMPLYNSREEYLAGAQPVGNLGERRIYAKLTVDNGNGTTSQIANPAYAAINEHLSSIKALMYGAFSDAEMVVSAVPVLEDGQETPASI